MLHETVKGIADSFLFFLAYSYLRQKRLIARDGGRSLPVSEEIGVGVVAGAFSKFFTTPIQQIVTRKQTATMLKQDSASSGPSLTSTTDIAHDIYKEKGLQGFWSGYSASLVLTLNPSITMLLHKVLLRLLVSRERQSDPGARLTFLLAAVSKALASTVTYPFSIAKTRAQISSQKPTTTTGETSESEKLERPASRAARMRQRTVFSTILRIAQTEGLWAVYQGLGAEVLKGFFSHGITMLMKDRIHSAIISLYYTVSQSLQKSPGADELAKNASEGAKDVFERGKSQASEVYAKSVEVKDNVTEKISEVTKEGSQQAQEVIERSKEQAGELYSRGAKAAETASSTLQGVMQSGSQQAADLLEASKDAARSTIQQTGEILEKGKVAAAVASQQAQDAVIQTDVKEIDGPDRGIKE